MPKARQRCPLAWRLHLAGWLYGKVMYSPMLQCFRVGEGPQWINWATRNNESTWREKHLGEVQLLLLGVQILPQEPVEPCGVSSFTISVA